MRRRYTRRTRSYKRKRSPISNDYLALAKTLTAAEKIERRKASLAKARAILASTTEPEYNDMMRDAFSTQARRYVSGRGAYSLGDFMRQAEPYADRFLTKGIPKIASAVSQLSPYAGALKQFVGRGSYNNLIEGGQPSMVVDSPNDETQSIVLSHCEFLQDIYAPSSASFSLQSWNLNPGLAENFPWLAQIAANYEEYEFVQLMFHYKSTVDASATNNSNGSTGTIIMATNYNPTAPDFTNKETMMQYHGAISGRITEDHIHGVECDPNKNAGTGQKYVRYLPVQINQDLKTFDLGKFQLAQINLPSTFFNQQVGELWVSYTVRLTKPRLTTAVLANGVENRWVSNGGETLDKPLGTNVLSMQQNALAITLDTTVDKEIAIQFPPTVTGVFDIQIIYEGTIVIKKESQWDVICEGSAKPYYDLFAGDADEPDVDNPTWLCYPKNLDVTFGYFTNAMCLARVEISPQVGNDVNIVKINHDDLFFTDTVLTQCQLIVRMTNSALSKYQTVDVPAYINSSGTVIQPY